MKLVTYEGIIENGQVQLPENISLPEKTKVYVIVPEVQPQAVPHLRSPRLKYPEQATDFEKKVILEVNNGSL